MRAVARLSQCLVSGKKMDGRAGARLPRPEKCIGQLCASEEMPHQNAYSLTIGTSIFCAAYPTRSIR